MPDITDPGLAPHVEPVDDPGIALGGTSIPFHADIFGKSHIAPSSPTVGGPSHMELSLDM